MAGVNQFRRRVIHGSSPSIASLFRLTYRGSRPDADATGPRGLIHRDFYPKQILVAPYEERVSIVDIDTLSWGARALDIGNFLAHCNSSCRYPGREPKLIRAFMRGCRLPSDHEEDVQWFRMAALLRLTAIALVSPGQARQVDGLLKAFRNLQRRA